MGGGLMQLVAYGAQDIYLTGNPQITFFKVVYRRHTNFSMETIEQTLNGTAAENQTTSCTISRNGDLVYRMYVTSTKVGVTSGATTLVSEAELEIGGQKIDKHYSEWMNVWNELSTPESKALALKSMQGSLGQTGVALVQIPLQFWFCRNPGLALPLIALQYHEVKVKITWGSDADNTSSINCDYIYLDTDERRRFAQVSHEYLIEQLQKEEKSTASQTHKLNFNHPVKELIWTTDTGDDYTKANLKLNGHDRFALQDTEYFQLRQPYECHTAVPRQNLPTAARTSSSTGIALPVQFVDENSATLLPTNLIGRGVAEGLTAGAADRDNESLMTEATLTLEVGGTGTEGQDTATALPAGSTIALVVTTVPAARAAGGGNDDATHGITGTFNGGVDAVSAATATAAAQNAARPFLGQVYFADVSSVAHPNNAHADIVLRSFLQASNGDIIKAIAVNDDGTANGAAGAAMQFKIYKVDRTADPQARTSNLTKNINVYSFALKPEEHQPSGTCNFSRIDNAQLIFETQRACTVYAVNYNVLRIMSGMGGLAYSN